MTELAIKGQPACEDKLLPLGEVAKRFGKDNQWVVRNIIQKGSVDCLKVNRSWFIKELSLAKFLSKVAKTATKE